MVKRAVILAGGFGTRFLPFTKAIPKPMLPIVDTPAIEFVVREALDSGITEILIVVGANGTTIQNHFSPNKNLNYAKITPDLTLKAQFSDNINIKFATQTHIDGTASAVLCAKNFVQGQPFLVMNADELFVPEAPHFTPASKQLIDAFNKENKCIIGIQRVSKAEASRLGVVEGEPYKVAKNVPLKVIKNTPNKRISTPHTIITNKPHITIAPELHKATESTPHKTIIGEPTEVVESAPHSVLKNEPHIIIENTPREVLKCKPREVIGREATKVSTLVLKEIKEKPPVEEIIDPLVNLGRYVVKPDIFAYLQNVRPNKANERALTDALVNYSNQNEQVICVNFVAKHYDIGNKQSYKRAVFDFSLLDPDFKQYAKTILQID